MVKVKLLKDLTRYNILGYEIKTLTGKKDEVVELKEIRANKLIKVGLAVEATDVDENFEPPPTVYLRNLKKDDIENLLRDYGVEADKRKTLESMRNLMVETVGSGLPDEAAKVVDLIKYYYETFETLLDVNHYSDENLSELTEKMGEILTDAFKNENA